MKRLNVDYNFVTEFGDLFRPSMRDSVRSILFHNNIIHIKDVCQLEEQQFRSFLFATDDVVKRVKERMNLYGLRFGMTLDELNAYQDADYLMLHPERESDGLMADDERLSAPFDFGKLFESDSQEDEEEKVSEPNKIEDHGDSDFANVVEVLSPYVRDFCESLQSQLESLLLEDRISKTLRAAYISQPWWMRVFCSPRYRLKVAMHQAALLSSVPAILKRQIMSAKSDSKPLEKEK